MVVLLTMFLTFFIMLTSSYQYFAPNTQKYEKLEKWGLENGLQKGKIEISFFNNYEKLYIATEDIEKGERVLSIPKKLFFDRTLPKSKKLSYYQDQILNTNNTIFHSALSKEQVFNTVHLMKLLKNRKSKVAKFFEPLFDFFPTDLSYFPVLYEPEEMKMLRFTFFTEIIKYSRHTMNEELKFLRYDFNLTLNIEEYIFYRALLVSRSFNILATNTIIPFTDLFQHHSKNYNLEWGFDPEENMLILKATRPINKGEVLVMANRITSNSQLLFFYGYTEENNYIVDDYQVDILHPYLRHQKNFTYTFYKTRMNLVNDSFIEDNIEAYNVICKYYDYKMDDKLAGYKLMLESLNYYAEDYEQIKESDYYSVLLNNRNRENIRRITEQEKLFLKFRIEWLTDYIKKLENKKEGDEGKKEDEEVKEMDDVKIFDYVRKEEETKVDDEIKKDDL
jgi:hypothetical protein